MKFFTPKIQRNLAILIVLLHLAAGLVAGWIYLSMKRSLPELDGNITVAGLTNPVSVERDALGVPTVKGANRLDVARALGWLHGQERFFQMDLLRRRAAGELSELFGAKAIAADKSARLHGFRRTALENIALLDKRELGLLEAYTEGVNAGLANLSGSPFEYALLRTDPKPWQAEDSFLVVYAMALELHVVGNYERSLTALRDTYGQAATNFFAPLLTVNDAALDGSTTEKIARIPSSRVIDLRQGAEGTDVDTAQKNEPGSAGSNSFALSGAHTANGLPLLANDMHLSLRAPNTWYRASLVWSSSVEGMPDHHVTGVTLPGIPLMVAGSNGHIAWGFTNAYVDTADVVVVEPNALTRSLYKYQSEILRIETRHEIINVRGKDPVDFEVNWTRWGPIIGEGDKTRPLAYRWIAHLPGSLNLSFIEMESARTVAEALPIAHRAGMPAQNIIVVDAHDNIAWSIAGKLPNRVGYNGRFPVSYTYGDRSWDGFLAPEKVPTIINPGSGRLWTANNRIIGGDDLQLLGDGGYEHPVRSAQIRDRLNQVEDASPTDLLAIQLDDHAPFLNRWHELLLTTLTPEVTDKNRSLAKMRDRLKDWDSRARVDSTSYPLVKLFRQQVAHLVFTPLFIPCTYKFDGFSWQRFHYEQPLWTLIEEKPIHLLDAKFDSWDELLIAAAEGVGNQLDEHGTSVNRVTWGKLNRAQIQHPMARIFPDWLTGWLSMPSDPLPGDIYTPRVQKPNFGASQRMVVSPGHETEGIFHMPTGQSGNPLSPYFRAGHEAWVKGEPTSFLPGATEHTLTLQPE